MCLCLVYQLQAACQSRRQPNAVTAQAAASPEASGKWQAASGVCFQGHVGQAACVVAMWPVHLAFDMLHEGCHHTLSLRRVEL